MNVTVIGTGYVGLVTGVCFAESGNDVVCVDIDENKVSRLSSGDPVIFEPGLEELLKKNIYEKRIRFTTSLKDGVDSSTLNFVAVGTPQDEDGSADLSHVLAVAKEIAEAMDSYKIVVTKSTVPVGTSERIRETIAKITKIPFDMASNPEFLKEGNAIEDFLKPDRIVIGTDTPKVAEELMKLYTPFVRNEHPVISMDIKSSELTKYASNSFLATKVSFINEIANIAERVGADISMVRKGMGADSRIGYQFIFPGIGYGGSCFPKDVQALIRSSKDIGYKPEILDAVEAVNKRQKEYLPAKIVKRFGDNLSGKKFALWGLSFKPKTDDMREAPSLVIVDRLLVRGAKVEAFDPVAIHEARRILGGRIGFSEQMYDMLADADGLIVATEWNEFRSPDFGRIAKLMRTKVIFDGRNIYNPREIVDLGFEYFSVGR